MLQLLMCTDYVTPVDFNLSGPGNKILVAGTSTLGYFGEVAASEFITGLDLINHIGLTTGTNRPNVSTTPWLKFVYNGKFLFMPKDSLKTGISWNQIYAAGAVYGTDDFGLIPANTKVNQYKPITFVEGDKTWRLVPRLIKATPTNPGTVVVGESSEWNDLISRLVNGTFQSWSMATLGLPTTSATAITMTTVLNYNSSCITRGRGTTTNWSGLSSADKNYAGTEICWKPVLELIPD